jgi:peptide deformylase
MKLQLHYEHEPALRKTAKPVVKITPKIKRLIDDMFETMYAANGIGLAANQVGVLQRVIVIDLQTKGSKRLALINPEIIHNDGQQVSSEGCLSCPGLMADVARAASVTVTALDPQGKVQTLEADNLLAAVLQHEIDHLNGVLFIDRLDATQRVRVEQQRASLKQM